jgi:hypothetical protein
MSLRAVLMMTAIGIGATAALVPTATAQPRGEIAVVREEMERLRAAVAEMEDRLRRMGDEVQATRQNVVTGGNRPGTFRLPGTDTSVQIGGYVKVDLIYDASEALGDTFVPESITTTDTGDRQRFRAHARQSRLFVRTFTPTGWGELSTWFEGDFFGAGGNEVFSNSSSFRLRHAVATIGGLTLGQTWSNFMPIESYPSTVDFQGPAGVTFIRQAQVRYTHALTPSLSLSASLENSEFSGRDAAGNPIAESTTLGIRAGVDKVPDVTVAATWRGSWGLLKLAGVGRILGSPNGVGDDAIGWGVNISGNTSLWPGNRIMGAFTYGDGLGRYLTNGFGQDAFVDAAGNVNPIRAFGVVASIRQEITKEVAAQLTYGRAQFEESRRPTDLDNVNTVHASLFWTPIPRLTFGGELIWGNREDASGRRDDAWRFQLAAQVNF